ncbi:methyltransferase family protein [Tamaricihabitans halophyticus]|uniref:Methyltransferase family protein n=2 Tax=Tamaricihabitans halophyticus TaxID=1262583 RepID=A0A4R2R0B4_9PSEU|nr:methyltransferase family protein [Tamaricihabitans halophyticus]
MLSKLLDTTFRRPKGPLGRLGGLIMSQSNAETEQQLVRLANLSSPDTVLVIGPGPGVGLHAAAERAGHVIGIDPSVDMLHSAAQRCERQIAAGVVELRAGTAEQTGQPPESVDTVLSTNNVQIWPDRPAAFAELHRVLRPGGRLLLSAHERWLPVPKHDLADELRAAGFTDVQAWSWQPVQRSTVAAQLSALRP